MADQKTFPKTEKDMVLRLQEYENVAKSGTTIFLKIYEIITVFFAYFVSYMKLFFFKLFKCAVNNYDKPFFLPLLWKKSFIQDMPRIIYLCTPEIIALYDWDCLESTTRETPKLLHYNQ